MIVSEASPRCEFDISMALWYVARTKSSVSIPVAVHASEAVLWARGPGGVVMQEYLIKPILMIIPTVLAITVVVFLAMRLIPGEPIDFILAEDYSEETRRNNLA